MTSHYGHWIRVLYWCTHQRLTQALEQMDLTAAQGQILGFLASQPEPVYPKDIEQTFRLSHPTVSGLLSRMEQKGFLALLPDPQDRRRKRISVLPKGRQCQSRLHQTMEELQARIVQDFTPEEQSQFAALLRRATANIGGNFQQPHKEES